MATLTESQIQFLESQGIPLSTVFDATGMKRSVYSAIMEKEGKHFAFGVTPCTKGGHTLRTRKGTCIQCDTANIAYYRRHFDTAEVYIAGSKQLALIKVGSSKECNKRIEQLNQMEFGGTSDWMLLGSISTQEAGRVEFHVHSRLRSKQKQLQYAKQGRMQLSYECFSCDYSEAKEFLFEMYSEADRENYVEQACARYFDFS